MSTESSNSPMNLSSTVM